MDKKFKLPKKVKTKWLKALRSGEFEQGTVCLRNTDIDDFDKPYVTYCCLGVACKIGIAKPEDNMSGEFVKESFLPKEIQLKLASHNDGIQVTSDETEKVFNKNGTKWSFKQIANWIYKNL